MELRNGSFFEIECGSFLQALIGLYISVFGIIKAFRCFKVRNESSLRDSK
jgi:hypothetical protein